MSIFTEIKTTLVALSKSKPAILIFVVILMLMAYGTHGNMELLKFVWKDWSYPGVDTGTRTPILAWIPWDREFISFIGGFLLLVLIPCALIKWKFRENLADYGLAWPAKEMRKPALVFFLVLTVVCAIGFYFGTNDPGMQAVYPFYKTFSGLGEFILYEISYFPFFVVIEFVFRGYLLVGLSKYLQKDGNAEFGMLAILIAMLPYCSWHLGKPLTELWGTPVWGLVAGAGVYITRSVWPVLFAHWLLNIWLDGWILHHLHLPPFAG